MSILHIREFLLHSLLIYLGIFSKESEECQFAEVKSEFNLYEFIKYKNRDYFSAKQYVVEEQGKTDKSQNSRVT